MELVRRQIRALTASAGPRGAGGSLHGPSAGLRCHRGPAQSTARAAASASIGSEFPCRRRCCRSERHLTSHSTDGARRQGVGQPGAPRSAAFDAHPDDAAVGSSSPGASIAVLGRRERRDAEIRSTTVIRPRRRGSPYVCRRRPPPTVRSPAPSPGHATSSFLKVGSGWHAPPGGRTGQ